MPPDAQQPPTTNMLFDVWLLSRATHALLDAALEPAGLTADEFAVYSVLRSGPLTPSELAAWMAAPLTTVSSYVKRFQARGHVTRAPNPADARSYRLLLTEDGARAHEEAGSLFLPVLAEVEEALGRSTRTVQPALSELMGALDVVRNPPIAR